MTMTSQQVRMSDGSQREASPSSSSMSALEGLQPPRVAAAFPTLVIIQWVPPLFSSQSRDVGRPLSAGPPSRCWWQYTVEWSCACVVHTGQPSLLTTTNHWLLLPRPHPQDDLHVRIVAREESDRKPQPHTSPTRVAAAHVTFTAALLDSAACQAPTPWLSPTALAHGCLFDALFLSLHATNALVSMPPQRRELLQLAVKGVQVLHDTPFSVITARYDNVRAPLRTRRVRYYVACTIPARREVDQPSPSQLLSRLEADDEDGATLIFCGFGELAEKAVSAARELLAAAADTGRAELGARVLCMSYGAARPVSLRAPLSAVRYAGHFLFYELPAADTFSPSAALSRTVPASALVPPTGTAADDVQFFSCGVRARLTHSPSLACPGSVHATAPCLCREPVHSAGPLSTEEAGLAELVRLLPIVLPRTPRLLAPLISSVEVDCAEDDATAVAVVRGHNLHYSPCLCASVASHGAVLGLRVVNAAPHMLIGRGSLMACLCLVHQADREAGLAREMVRTLALRVTVSTTMGTCTATEPPALTLAVPASIARLAWLGCLASVPRPRTRASVRGAQWLVALPAVFLFNAVRLQPLQYTSTADLGTALRSTVGLCQLASCAELVRRYVDKAAGNPLLSFFSSVASKVGPPDNGRRRAELEPITLDVPNALEAAYFMTSLGHGIGGTRRDMSRYRDRASSWLSRLLATLPWLCEAELYERKLLALLHVFRPPAPSSSTGACPRGWPQDAWETLPLVALEQRLYNDIGLHLGDALISGTSPGTRGVITDALGFEGFYGALHGPLLAAVPVTHPVNDQLAAQLVLEAAAVWSFCVLHETRCDAARHWTVAVVVGGGREDETTTAAATSALRGEWAAALGDPDRSRRGGMARLRLKCVLREDLTVLSDVLSHNVLDSLCVVGTVDDYENGTITSLVRSLEASAGTRKGRMTRDQWHCFLLKADEALARTSPGLADPKASPPPGASDVRDWETRLRGDLDRLSSRYPERPVILSVTPPSPAAMQTYLAACGADAGDTRLVEVVSAALTRHSKRELQNVTAHDMIVSEA